MTLNETAKSIRRDLKEILGANARQVSVRQTGGGGIRVEIKDPTLAIGNVKMIAESYRRVRYCEASGEILSGGNTFVSVRYSSEAETAMVDTYGAGFRTARDQALLERGLCIPVEGMDGVAVSQGLTDPAWEFSVWLGSSHVTCAARTSGEMTVSGGPCAGCPRRLPVRVLDPSPPGVRADSPGLDDRTP